MNMILICGLLLALKHFIADGPLQTPYQYINKGAFLHPGGLLHAAIHGAATVAIFAPFGFWYLGIVDGFVHYFIDLVKVKATKKYKWSELIDFYTYSGDVGRPLTRNLNPHLAIYSDWYFYALVADQALHFATYIGLIWWVTWH